jgi:hypothetical protein
VLPGGNVKRRITQKIEIRKTTLNAYGYLTIRYNRVHFMVHRLVLTAFLGPPLKGAQSRHINGNPADNRLVNLKWGSRSENEADKIMHGRTNRGERHYRTTFSIEDVKLIRNTAGPRGIVAKLAKQYGVAHQTISGIRTGTTWRHI